MQIRSDNAGNSPVDSSPISAEASRPVPDTLLRKLLLVDDEVDGAEVAAVLLRASGLQVVVVHSASEALQALQQDQGIDAVLSDILMPGMTGLQLADAIRAMYPTIKIVLMSGYVPPDLRKDRESDYLFVAKPYKIETLLKVIFS
ncbi:MAG: response regulator [Telluria sp.]